MIEISDEGSAPRVNIDRRATWKRRASILSKYIGAQTLIQLVSLLAGFLLVRKFSPQEYAFFTIAGTMQGTIGILSESGVGSALSAIGGRVWQDKFRFGQLIQTALVYRRKLWLFGSAVVTPVLLWTLIHKGCHPLYAVALCVIVNVSTNFQLSNGVLDLVLKMNTRLDLLQRTELAGALLRSICVGIICFTFRSTLLAVLAALGALVLQNSMFRRYADGYVDFAALPNAEDQLEITKAVKQVSPATIFYCFQGQVTIFLISAFGSTRNVAEVGALTRLGVIFLVVNTLISNVLLPRFARCQEESALRRMYWQIVGGFSVFSLVFVLATVVLPGPFLWLIGKNYSNLGAELPYAVTSAVVSSVGAVVFGLNFSRTWMRYAWTAIPTVICTQLVMLPFLNLSSIRDVLLLNIIPSLLSWLPYMVEASLMLRRRAV